MRYSASIAVAFGLVLSGCFHQVVQTGRTPGPTVVKKPWTATWLWGIVPAKPIDVTQDCPGGIATVETKQTFMNGLVGALTIGIFTPRDVTVTCATGTARGSGLQEFIVARDASQAEKAQVMADAIAASARSHQPVLVSLQQ
ncbi:MAG TPA: Bor family protein [Gemmatimonadaceae bacterium]